jgi:iron complex outermembrane receptor protein
LVVTGSLIKRVADYGAVPMDIITPAELDQQGVTSVEQMVMNLNINGNSLDNLASNSDVATGGAATRGINGSTGANLRFQGSNATLVLVNGRRVAQHGLNGGGTVDLNSIPVQAIKRIEVLKDGASSIYGTDAIGGVINFILKDDYQGLAVKTGFDVTQEGGADIYRASIVGGYGNLNKDKFNVMASLSYADNTRLLGSQRSWVNTQQPDRGISADTRGTPFATLSGLTTLSNVLSGATSKGSFFDPTIGLSVSTVNTLVLQGAGALAGTGMYPYDYQLWSNASTKYGATMDTGVTAALQQPVKNTNLVTSAAYKVGDTIFRFEGLFGRSQSTKYFSAQQITSAQTTSTVSLPNGTLVPNPLAGLAYPSTAPGYAAVFNTLVAAFPQLAGNNGLPMTFRWRLYPGGPREYSTQSDTWRALVSAEGPVPFLKDWDYNASLSRASSKSYSVLTSGYYYTAGLANLINTGVLNPFSFTQTDSALQQLAAVSAAGVKLYGGTYTTDNFNASATGPVWKLPAGDLQAALGVDYAKEGFTLAGDQRPNANTAAALIANAPFDNSNATLGTLTRTVKAVFAELDIPVIKGVDFNPSVRTDNYSGFGTTTNPKYTLRIQPAEWLLFRGSYSTGFRVPTFAQEFFPAITQPGSSAIVDPTNGNVVNSYNVRTGSESSLNPETARMKSVGVVLSPNKHLSFSADWWSIDRKGTIATLSVSTILANYTLFPDRLIRDASGVLNTIDDTYINAGEALTEGIELGAHANQDLFGGVISADIDLGDLLVKKSRILASTPFGPTEVGRFTRFSDLGIKYKATLALNYRRKDWAFTLTQIYRSGYMDNPEGNIGLGTYLPPNWNPKVASYTLYNLTASYTGLIKNLTLVAGIKNLFNTNPPFSAYYDTNSGAGSDWDPRVGDPRGRSFVLSAEYKFF